MNQGLGAAARMLQEAVGAIVDGLVGPETLARAAAQPADTTLARYADIRRRHYRSLATFWRFGKGWLARVDTALTAARALPLAQVSPTPSQRKEPAPMNDQHRPAAASPSPASTPALASAPTAAPAKWWGSSMTIWGAVVTALTTVLPLVGPLVGVDITADLIQQLGVQVVAATQAVGGLAGTILTIYGRARATSTLERREITLSV